MHNYEPITVYCLNKVYGGGLTTLSLCSNILQTSYKLYCKVYKKMLQRVLLFSIFLGLCCDFIVSYNITVDNVETPLLKSSFKIDPKLRHIESLSTNPDPADLFAVVGGSTCAETLYYGPQAIAKYGSADGQRPYFFSTLPKAAHKSWIQDVTSDGTTLMFRIYWSFTTEKTLSQRFADAVSVGESVTFRVVENTGSEYFLSGIWRFSSGSNSGSKFSSTTTTCCFSDDDGLFLYFTSSRCPFSHCTFVYSIGYSKPQ